MPPALTVHKGPRGPDSPKQVGLNTKSVGQASKSIEQAQLNSTKQVQIPGVFSFFLEPWGFGIAKSPVEKDVPLACFRLPTATQPP